MFPRDIAKLVWALGDVKAGRAELSATLAEHVPRHLAAFTRNVRPCPPVAACVCGRTAPPSWLISAAREWRWFPVKTLAGDMEGKNVRVQELDMLITAFNSWGLLDETTAAVARQMRVTPI